MSGSPPLSLASDFKDFEDAAQYYSAVQARTDCVVTRNKASYRAEGIPVMTPEEFLAAIKS